MELAQISLYITERSIRKEKNEDELGVEYNHDRNQFSWLGGGDESNKNECFMAKVFFFFSFFKSSSGWVLVLPTSRFPTSSKGAFNSAFVIFHKLSMRVTGHELLFMSPWFELCPKGLKMIIGLEH